MWTVSEGFLICLLIYFSSKLFRHFFARSSLADISGPSSSSWLKGNFYQIFDRKGWRFHLEMTEKYGSVVKVKGPLGADQLYVSDPRALHYITVKEQHIYDEIPGFYAGNKLVFGISLLSTKGEHHKKMRKMLNPVFSLKHMRDMPPIFYPIAHRLRDILKEKVNKGEGDDLDVMRWMSRAALEYIGQGGMGYTFDALDETKTNNYSDALKMLSPLGFNLIMLRHYSHYIKMLGPPKFRVLLLRLIPWRDLHTFKKVVDVMDKASVDIYEEKKEKLRNGDDFVVKQIGRGKDIMSVLLKANMAANKEDRLPEAELIGQMNTFIVAGHDTTTSALSRILHVLTLNPAIQDRLRSELTDAIKEHGEELDYDTLMALPFLDAVCREVLRIYPPLSVLNRVTIEPTTMPLYRPIKSTSGEIMHSIPIKKNTRVIVSIIGANRNKDVWGDDADEFKPERWLGKRDSDTHGENWFGERKEEKDKVSLPGVYSGMMTFFGGSRACIGFKFSELEMKIVLSVLIPTFKFSLSPGNEIEWNMSTIQSPMVKGEKGLEPKLPLKVELV